MKNTVLFSTERCPLLGVADEPLAAELAREIDRIIRCGRVAVASSLPQLQTLAERSAPEVILIDCNLLGGAPLSAALQPFVAAAPVVLLGPFERQEEVAKLVAAGDVEFVARAGDFVPLAAAMLDRRLRWARMSGALPGPPWAELPEDMASLFRHEINNPLTGILGNAELVLTHRDRLTAADARRLQTVVGLAVRLRETVRRLSNAWERRPAGPKPSGLPVRQPSAGHTLYGKAKA